MRAGPATSDRDQLDALVGHVVHAKAGLQDLAGRLAATAAARRLAADGGGGAAGLRVGVARELAGWKSEVELLRLESRLECIPDLLAAHRHS